MNIAISQKCTIIFAPNFGLVMSKILYDDKAQSETLRKLGFGYCSIVAKFQGKGWKLCSVKAICKQVDERGSATE